MVASSGGSNRRARGSCLIPSAARTCGGASATHSPTAASDCAPASTAATAASNKRRQAVPDPARVSRIGHLLYSSRLGHWPVSNARSPAGRSSCSSAALIGDDDKAGTVFQQ